MRRFLCCYIKVLWKMSFGLKQQMHQNISEEMNPQSLPIFTNCCCSLTIHKTQSHLLPESTSIIVAKDRIQKQKPDLGKKNAQP